MKNTCVLSFDAVVLSDVVAVLLFTGTLPFIFSNTMRLGVTDHFLPWCLRVKCCFPKLFFFVEDLVVVLLFTALSWLRNPVKFFRNNSETMFSSLLAFSVVDTEPSHECL